VTASPCLSILILTEDSAADAHETITALVKKMLQLLVPGCQTHRVDFEPQGENAARAMHGNRWKSRNPRDRQKIVDLRQSIATKLVEGTEHVPGFVMFHIDGDRRWAEQSSSENVTRFEEFVRTYVEPIVSTALARQGRAEEIPARMARLRRLTPFYSVEAWLYQNTGEARRLCETSCGRHVQQIEAWEAAREELDEIEKPKESLCIAAEHNRTLATLGFPAAAVFAVEKSYTATVLHLLDCPDLCTALARTYA
jgi:hypothetical protein